MDVYNNHLFKINETLNPTNIVTLPPVNLSPVTEVVVPPGMNVTVDLIGPNFTNNLTNATTGNGDASNNDYDEKELGKETNENDFLDINGTLNPTVLTPSTSSPTFLAVPTQAPTLRPTLPPALSEASEAEMNFVQEFWVPDGREFSDDDLRRIEMLYEGYTQNFVDSSSAVLREVHTDCTINRMLYTEPIVKDIPISIDFQMRYESKYHNVASYPYEFETFLNSNQDIVVQQLQTLGVDVDRVGKANMVVVATKPPITSPLQPTNSSTTASTLLQPTTNSTSSIVANSTTTTLIPPTSSTNSSFVPNNPATVQRVIEPTTTGETVTIVVVLVIAALVAIIGIRLVAARYGYCGGSTSGRKDSDTPPEEKEATQKPTTHAENDDDDNDLEMNIATTTSQ